uniref:Secreted protein n=1 Tax=Knipowitschia caucasica TaxID=637954 RepID=A0AAV2KXB0_KNICA
MLCPVWSSLVQLMSSFTRGGVTVTKPRPLMGGSTDTEYLWVSTTPNSETNSRSNHIWKHLQRETRQKQLREEEGHDGNSLRAKEMK